MTPKIHLPSVEFYITNICNLTCSECNRFNNQRFSGHYRFDYEVHQRWAEKIDIGETHLLGGEPTFNPELPKFIQGISELWPNSLHRLVTNGLNLSYHKSCLHILCAQFHWMVEISVHNPDHLEAIHQQILETFGVPKFKSSMTPYPDKRELIVKIFGDYTTVDQEPIPGTLLSIITERGVHINLVAGWTFHKNAIKNKLTLETYRSNPLKAHELCTMKGGRHLIDGKLYKCGVVKTLPEMLTQNNKSVNPLMLEYMPLGPDANLLEIKNLSKCIPQCTFCSDNPEDWTAEISTNAQIKGKSRVISIKDDKAS